jgi:hypothetical protein
MRRHFLFSCLVIIFCVFLAGSTWAEEKKPSGTIYAKSTAVAIGIGVNWGNGKLNYNGKEYDFTVKGVSVIDLGITSVELTGEVYNLESVSDFAGSYTAATAGAHFGDASVGTVVMENGKKVVIKAKAKGEGVRLTLAPAGMVIKMKE